MFGGRQDKIWVDATEKEEGQPQFTALLYGPTDSGTGWTVLKGPETNHTEQASSTSTMPLPLK